MNSRDPSERELEAAFRDRLEASPEPPVTLLARTLAAIDAPGEIGRAPTRRSSWAARWWLALAVPARFGLAAAIVIVGGTIALGTFNVARERSPVGDVANATRLSIDHRAGSAPARSRSATISLDVTDLGHCERALDGLARDQHGSLKSIRAVTEASASPPAAVVVLRVPSAQLDSTLRAIAGLGRVRARSIESVDLAGAIAAVERALSAARTRTDASGVDLARQLAARRAALRDRTNTSIIAIELRAIGSNRASLERFISNQREHRDPPVRPTGISLVWSSHRASFDALWLDDRARTFDAHPSRGIAADPRAGRICG